MARRLCSWTRDDRGTTSIEYAILAALISCGIIVSTRTIGGNLTRVYAAVADGLGSSEATAAPAPAAASAVRGNGS